MKKAIITVLMFVLCAYGIDAGNVLAEADKGITEVIAENSVEEMSELEQIDAQLQGIWICEHSDSDFTEVWTFYNGSYVQDSYMGDDKQENSTIGTYAIGADAIHTITIDQTNNVEGSIPYTFENGILTLNPVSEDIIVYKKDSEFAKIAENVTEVSGLDTEEETTKSVTIVERIEMSEILDWPTVYQDIMANQARAEDYNDIWYAYMADVVSIGTASCILSGEESADDIEVYMGKDDLKALNPGDNVIVIGCFDSLLQSYRMKDAILLDDDTVRENFVFGEVSMEGDIRSATYSDYVYDEGIGQIVSYNVSGDENGKHTLTYDENGNLIVDEFENRNSNYGTETHTYTYYEDGTKKSEVETYSTDNVRNGTTFEYTHEKNDLGQVVKTTAVNVTSDNYTLIYEYIYDEDGNVIEELQSSPNSVYDINYMYDAYGNLSSESSYNIDKPSSISRTEHEFKIIAKR